MKEISALSMAFSLAVSCCANAKPASPIPSEFVVDRITLCEPDDDGFSNGLLKRILPKDIDRNTTSDLTKVLAEKSTKVDVGVLDNTGELCYVAMEDSKQRKCIIARIQISSGVIVMLNGIVKEDGFKVVRGEKPTAWKCDEFVGKVVRLLESGKPEYLSELNSFYLRITGQSVADHLNKPLKSSK
jgi:hypothetical protein